MTAEAGEDEAFKYIRKRLKEEKKIKGKNKAGHQISKLKARESKKIYKKIDHWKSKKSSKQRKNKEIKL